MTRTASSYTGSLAALGAVLALLATAASAAQAPEPPALAEARRLFEALDYERTLPLLDQVVSALAAERPVEPDRRRQLLNAYEMRARARFGVGDMEGAAADFRAVLQIDPAFALDPGVSPRVVSLLDDVKAATLGTLQLTLEPADATMLVDGVPVAAAPGGQLPVLAGAHMLRAMRPGYRAADQAVSVAPGETVPVSFVLERTASVLTLVTSPPDTEVIIDGQPRGRTAAGPLPESLSGVPGTLGVPPAEVSQPFVVADLGTGSFQLEFRRDCYETERRVLTVESLADLVVDPIRLQRAVGTLVVRSVPEGAEVRLDGEAKGVAPLTLTDVCAGTHTIAFFGDEGRALQRVEVSTGARLEVRGEIRPAFALLGPTEGVGDDDPRSRIERAFGEASQVLLFAPEPADVAVALREETVDAVWFGLREAERAPTAADRRQRLARLAERFGAQGLVWVEPAAPGSPEMQLALVAAGSAEPDVLGVSAGSSDSISRALSRLETPVSLVRPSLGALVVDVLDQEGPVVARLDSGGPAEAAGLAVGAQIRAVGTDPVRTAGDLRRLLDARRPGEAVSLTVAGGADGAARTVSVTLGAVPVLLTGTDRFLATNVAIAVLRTRLDAAADGLQAGAIRLNLAAALLRAGDPEGASSLLAETSLPVGAGVSQGTVEYLRGQAAFAAGDTAAARAAWEVAARADGRLTDDGPLVSSLARRALARLQ